MIVGIDASNIKSDGGVIHLLELINNLDYKNKNFKKIVIWGNSFALKKINSNKNIIKISIDKFSKNIIKRLLWQFFILPKKLKTYNCSILFVLGSFLFKKKIKTVIIFQNILPFIKKDIIKYKFIQRAKMFVQKKLYLYSFKSSDGIIFLSNFSKKILSNNINLIDKKTKLIPHGVSRSFKFKKRKIGMKKKIELLYVSTIDFYKNQNLIILALKDLNKHFKVNLNLVGAINKDYKYILDELIDEHDLKDNVKFYGKVPYENLPKIYNKNDIKIHFSKSETFGMTMLEAMKCGLPVVSIKDDISKEILKNSGFYCKSSIKDINKIIFKIINEGNILSKKILIGQKISKNYKWKFTSKKTFAFLKEVSKV